MNTKSDVRDVALNLLARREHGFYELSQKLEQRGFSSTEIQPVLETLREKNQLSDVRFVQMIIGERLRQGYGPLRIRQELLAKHVDKVCVDDEIANINKTLWQEALQHSRRKKSALNPDDPADKAKLVRYLQYRGFPLDLILA